MISSIPHLPCLIKSYLNSCLYDRFDYGGWGIRYNRKGTAYTIDGKLSLELKLISGENILVGIPKSSNFNDLKKI